jgi:hypothetical protein
MKGVWVTCEAPRAVRTFDLGIFLKDPQLAVLLGG